jgi:hypothetical protein
MRNKTWNLRGQTSLLTLAGFLIMAVTGLVLYVVPQGRIAYWTNWTFLNLTKSNWGDVHILSSILFIIAGAFHIYFNWKPLMNYLRDRTRGGMKLKKEIAVSVVAMVLVTVSNLSLSDIGKKVGVDGAQLLKRLAAKEIKGTADESLKKLATRNGIAPLELLKAALVPSYRPAK